MNNNEKTPQANEGGKGRSQIDRFAQGYTCAIGCIIHGHGTGTEVGEAWKQSGYKLQELESLGVDPYDIERIKTLDKQYLK